MTGLLPCPFCGAPAIILLSIKLRTHDIAVSCSNKSCGVATVTIPVETWNYREKELASAFEQYQASLAESERKLKIAQKKLERIDALIETGCRAIGGEMLVILPIQAILGESDE